MNLDSAPVADVDRRDAFHDLLSMLAGALSIRESFHRLSDIVSAIVPHDEGRLVLLNEETGTYDRYLSPDQPEVPRSGEDNPLEGPAVPSLVLDEPDRTRGFRAGGRLVAVHYQTR
jgi:hypothetical protein